jgi:E-phenylitaconyl-CoA hydratase
MGAESGEAPLIVSREGGVGWIRLNRPERRNAISRALREALEAALSALDADEEIRVAVLTGAGTAFCSGVDLTEGRVEPAQVDALGARRVSAALDGFGKPIVAAINGPAVGGGLELALAADLRIASSTATFALTEVKIGSLPGSGGTQRLIAATSAAIASKLIFTGEPIDADTALRCGLVSDVVAPDELPALTSRIAGAIAANAPLSLRAAKLALRAARPNESAGLTVERALWGLLAATDDRAEGRAAFREHRPPHFKGS